jgi:hypothetical protein
MTAKPYFTACYDVLTWTGKDFDTNDKGQSAKFATIDDALDSLRAKYGDRVSVEKTDRITLATHGYIQHWLRPLSDDDCVRPMVMEVVR